MFLNIFMPFCKPTKVPKYELFSPRMEIGGPFLAFLKLTLNLVTNSTDMTIEFDIYRKPTYTGTSIHGQSLHTHRYNAAIINHAIHRLLNLPLSDKSKKNANLNGLNLDIRSMVRKKSLRLLLASSNLSTIWLPLPLPNAPSGLDYHSWVKNHTSWRKNSKNWTIELVSTHSWLLCYVPQYILYSN